MDYKKIYDEIISKAKSENRKKGKEIYFESHHILPKCLGGGNEKENLVLLTAREHYVCHKILHYIYPNNSALSLAYHSMTYMKKDKRKLKLTSREYEEVRIAHSNAVSGENNSMFGKKMNPDSIKKQLETKRNKPQTEIDAENKRRSESLSGKNNPNYGKSAHPNVIEAFKLYNLTKTVSQDVRDKISEALIGKERDEDAIQKQKETIENNGGVWNKGKTGIYSKESLEKNRLSHLGKIKSPEEIFRREETNRNKTPEQKAMDKQNRINAQKGKSKNPISAAKSAATRKRLRINALPKEVQLIEEEKLIMIF